MKTLRNLLILAAVTTFLLGCSTIGDAASRSAGAISQATDSALTVATHGNYYDVRFNLLEEGRVETPRYERQTLETLEEGREADIVVSGNVVAAYRSELVYFDDPISAFEDPIWFEDPMLSFDVPIISFKDPILSFETPVFLTTGLWEESGRGNLISSKELAEMKGVPVLLPMPTYPAAGQFTEEGFRESVELAHFYLPVSISVRAMETDPEGVAAFVQAMIDATNLFSEQPDLYLEALEKAGAPAQDLVEKYGKDGATSWITSLASYRVEPELFSNYAREGRENPLGWNDRAVILLGRDGSVELVPSILADNYAIVGPDLMPDMEAAGDFYATSAFDPGGRYFTPERVGANSGWFIDTGGFVMGAEFEPIIP